MRSITRTWQLRKTKYRTTNSTWNYCVLRLSFKFRPRDLSTELQSTTKFNNIINSAICTPYVTHFQAVCFLWIRTPSFFHCSQIELFMKDNSSSVAFLLSASPFSVPPAAGKHQWYNWDEMSLKWLTALQTKTAHSKPSTESGENKRW